MKKLRLIIVATRPPAWLSTAEQFYSKQLQRFELAITAIRPSTKEKEATLILEKCPPATHLILLDVRGKALNSETFATTVGNWLQQTTPVLVIAGAHGAAQRLSDTANEVLSLSALTFPHALARLVLVEQLFRADCILRNHPYPR